MAKHWCHNFYSAPFQISVALFFLWQTLGPSVMAGFFVMILMIPLNTVATAVGEEAGTIEEVYEPFLIMEGYLQRTPRGRLATERAYRHLGRVPTVKPGSLFE